MKRTIIFLIGLIVLGLSACKKGEIGPDGPQGEKGERGEQGIAGIDGTKILSGTAVPTANVGTVGDYYLRMGTAVLYGPKNDAGWGSGVSLKGTNGSNGATGATGAKGANGTKILSGTAVPSTSQGVAGDFYFQTNTGILYGPKTGNSWGVGTSLKGPKGDKGDTGNANVKVFEIGRRTFTGTLHIDLPISYNDAIKMHMLVYVRWYNPMRQVPFRLENLLVDYTTFPYNNNFRVDIYARDPKTFKLNTNSLTFSTTKIVFVEASEVIKIASQGIDLNNFEQVKTALKF